MTKSEKRMWLTNIENAGDAVVAEYGSEVVQSVFQRYDAHGTYDLSPATTVKFSLIWSLSQTTTKTKRPEQGVKLLS